MKLKIAILFFLISVNSLGQKQIEVFFDFNKDFPNPASVLVINEWISKNKDAEITKLLGYCDSIDTKNYNIKLSERRIENVQALLVKNGLKFSKDVEKTAFGKDFQQSKVQAENRKVTLFYNEPPVLSVESDLSRLIRESKIGEKIKLSNIYFYGGLDKVLAKSEPTLKELSKALNENPKLKIEVQGHVCCYGSNEYFSLSVARAKAICDFLSQNGIGRNRLDYKGFGSKDPVFPLPEKDEEQRGQS